MYNERIKKEVVEKVRQYKEGKPCTDCGRTYHFSAMDFDHVKGDKKYSIARMGSSRWEVVLAEIEKCELVCANCHRVRTWKRKNGLIV